MSGVALPNTTGNLPIPPKILAISFALYLGVLSDLYELSCSSSIIIIPIFSVGANIADLVPIIMFAFPSFILFHSSYLSPIDNLLCNIAIFSFPNLPNESIYSLWS